MTDHLDLTVTEAGSGERTVLVLHGGSGPDGVASLVEHLARTTRVLAPIHPGWADTPRPDWFTGVDDLAITYLDLLADRGHTGVTVLGSSFGGWVASEMAIRDRGGQLAGIVLLDGIGPEIDGYQIRPPARRPGMPEFSAMTVYSGENYADSKLLRRLACVTLPARFVWGEDDPVAPVGFGKVYAQAYADSEFHVLPGVGHLPALQAPAETFALIDEFLRARAG